MSTSKSGIISSVVSSTLSRVLRATGLSPNADAPAPERANWEALYRRDAAGYERHRAALLAFIKGVIEPALEQTVDPHRYSSTVNAAASIPSVYPNLVEVVDSGSGYDISLPSGSIDPGTIVFARAGGSSTIRLLPTSSEEINGASSLTLPSTHGAVMIARVTGGWVALT